MAQEDEKTLDLLIGALLLGEHDIEIYETHAVAQILNVIRSSSLKYLILIQILGKALTSIEILIAVRFVLFISVLFGVDKVFHFTNPIVQHY